MSSFTPFMPVTPDDKRQYEGIIKALILMLGTQTDGKCRLTFDSSEMNRASAFELHMGRNLDPYRLILEVEPK